MSSWENIVNTRKRFYHKKVQRKLEVIQKNDVIMQKRAEKEKVDIVIRQKLSWENRQKKNKKKNK